MTRARAADPWVLAAAALGAAVGASAFLGGAYDPRLWVPLGVVALLAAAALAALRPVPTDRRTRVALGALAGLGLWQLASSLWGASPHAAFVEADRTFALTGVLGLAVLLARDRRTRSALLLGVLGGVGAVGLAIVVQLLLGRTELFLLGRLDEPLGYVNAQAAVLAMGAWLAFGVAAGGSRLRAGVGAGTATALAALVVLVQSRGAILASIVAVLVVLALARDRRTRLLQAVVVVGAVGAASPVLLDVFSEGPTPGRLRGAALAVVLAAVLSGAVWALASAALERAGGEARRRGARALDVGVAAVVVVGLALAALNASAIADQVRAFTDVGGAPTLSGNDASRLASGTGNRLDYWRIALDVVADHPLGGVGAGSYAAPYLKERRTTEVVYQPHSLELQALSETGPLGLLLVLAGVGAIGLAAVRLARSPDDGDPATRAVRLGALGATTAYLAHTSVDWLHLVPGVAGMAVVLGAVLLTWDAAPARVPVARRAVALPVAVAVVLAIAVLSVARQGLADRDVRRAQAAVATRPAEALDAADGALRLDGQDLDALYARAGALTRLGRPQDAEATLRRATRIEPRSFTAWLLLGDAALRRDDPVSAARSYLQAIALNPREAELYEAFQDAVRRYEQLKRR